MIFTLTDRAYNPLDAYETSDYLIGSYVGSIIKSLDINILTTTQNVDLWVSGNYIMCSDDNGYKYWFTIYDAQDGLNDTSKTLKAYSGTIDIVSEDALAISRPATAQPFQYYFDQIFFDTGVVIGTNEISDLTRSLEFESTDVSNAEMLQYVLNAFDNAEADLAVEFLGSVPSRVVLNVFHRIGKTEPQTLVSDMDDSLTSLMRSGSINGLATCLNVFGGTDEATNTPITLEGVYYEEIDEDGNIIYYSPLVSNRIFSVVGRKNFFVELPGKDNGEFDGYINRRYDSSALSQDALWSAGLSYLKKVDNVNVQYEAKGYIDCMIGDMIQIVSTEMRPPVMISARVLACQINYDDQTRNEYTFGNYTDLVSSLVTISDPYSPSNKPTPADIGAEPEVVSGSNVNGNYIRFSDGTQICYGRVPLNMLLIDGAWGSWFISDPLTITYPAAFVSAPASPSANMETTTGNIANWSNGLSTVSSFTGYFARGEAGSFNCTVGWFAMGRWK